jgi:FtsH-binding integral membrane protein
MMSDVGAHAELSGAAQNEEAFGARSGTGEPARVVFGQVMGLVALTAGCAALGAYLGRNLSGGVGIGVFVLTIGCVFGLQIAASAGREQLASGLLFALGLLLGVAAGPLLAEYADSDPAVLWQAAGSTAGFIAALGAFGYATRRDLSRWAQTLFWALLGLILFGIVAVFISIPHANVIYAALGLVIFGGFTLLDFNRLRSTDIAGAVPIAASIFLDVFNVFLFFLDLFGGDRD